MLCVPSELYEFCFSQYWYPWCRHRRSPASSFPSLSRRPSCRCTRSRFAPGMDISGPPDIGPTVQPDTSGCREPGCLLRGPVFFWTPGYWGFGGGLYLWHAGYWGPHVGFYGGVNYGYGYGGVGFYGGRWEGGHFAYNTAVLHVNTTDRSQHLCRQNRDPEHNGRQPTSFNGPNGINARPSGQEMAAMRE